MSAPELRTPAEWSALDGVTVMDPDGWRGTKTLPAKSWDEPISHDEWIERLSVSTQTLRTTSTEDAKPLSVVDRVALRLMRTQIYGTLREQRWDEGAHRRWRNLDSEQTEDYRRVARELLADIAVGDKDEMPAQSEYEVRDIELGVRGPLDDIGDAVDFSDHVWPGSKVFERTRVTLRTEWTEVTA